MRVLLMIDKFKGTATSLSLSTHSQEILRRLGHEVRSVLVSDGGEGLGAALGGVPRTLRVLGALGEEVDATWYVDGDLAVIECASVAGLALVGGSANNKPMDAHTIGVGQLIGHALHLGFTKVVIGCGGSASTDGGAGAIAALGRRVFDERQRISALYDVETKFLDAAREFAPQKGANQKEVTLLRERLVDLSRSYLEDFGVDVTSVVGTGAAGGLSGGLYALGAHLSSGFDFLWERRELWRALEWAEVVVTGEGFFDRSSLDGKVVGKIIERSQLKELPVVVVAGQVDRTMTSDIAYSNIRIVSLAETYGISKASEDPISCLGDVLLREFAK